MSFDLVVWSHEGRASREEAVRIYDVVMDGLFEPGSDQSAIESFHHELMSLYPDDDESPWSMAPEVVDGAVVVTLSWSRATEIAPKVLQTARDHGLTVYDPQETKVYPI